MSIDTPHDSLLFLRPLESVYIALLFRSPWLRTGLNPWCLKVHSVQSCRHLSTHLRREWYRMDAAERSIVVSTIFSSDRKLRLYIQYASIGRLFRYRWKASHVIGPLLALVWYDYLQMIPLELVYVWKYRTNHSRISTFLFITLRYALIGNVLYLFAITNQLPKVLTYLWHAWDKIEISFNRLTLQYGCIPILPFPDTNEKTLPVAIFGTRLLELSASWDELPFYVRMHRSSFQAPPYSYFARSRIHVSYDGGLRSE
jgi:hypothetical protein